jgi:4-amino-4-deoxy-L-arabinose transferase-like glycosyltransferase
LSEACHAGARRPRGMSGLRNVRSWPAWAWVSLATLVSFLLHLPFFGLPMISDEGGYAYVAQRWFDGRGELYDNIWVSRPQGIFVAYGFIFKTIGPSIIDIRIGAWVFSALTLIFVWLFANEWAGRRVAILATLLFAVISGSPAIEGFTANAEVFMALPATAGAWLLLYASRRGWGTLSLIGVGIMAGLATVLKPSGVVMIPIALVFVALASLDGNRAIVRRCLWIMLGVAIVAAPTLIHGWMIGWHRFVFASITYRLEFQSSTTVSTMHHVRAIGKLFHRTWMVLLLTSVVVSLQYRLSGRPIAARQWFAKLTEAPRVGIVAQPTFRPATRLPGGDVLLRLWLLGSLAGIAMGGDWWYHYLVQILAPFAVWFALALLDLKDRLTRNWRVMLVVATLFVLLLPYSVVRQGSAGNMSRALFNHPGYPAQQDVADYLRGHTKPETPIFVAFDQAALYYLSDLPSTYRYMYDQELRALPGAEDELVTMVESPYRPVYIVGTRQRAPFPDRGQAFWNAVSEHYHLESMVRGVPIYRANDPLKYHYTDLG